MALRNNETISAVSRRLYILMDEKEIESPKVPAKALYSLGLVHVKTRENFNSPPSAIETMRFRALRRKSSGILKAVCRPTIRENT